MSAESLLRLSRASTRFADGDLQLTSRANLQLRGVATAVSGAVSTALVDEVMSAGLLPHPRHERVRNIVASPLTGLLGGHADLRGLIAELDETLCADDDLTDLPGPFLFTLDDGRGDLDDVRADLGVRALDADTVSLRVGDLTAAPTPLGAAANELIRLARAFLVHAGGADDRPIWHVRELPLGGRELLPTGVEPDDQQAHDGGDRPVLGLLRQIDGMSAVSVLVPLGVLGPEQCAAVVRMADSGTGQLVITPWRGLIIPGLSESDAEDALRQLAATGLVVEDESGWAGITACSGAPRCAQGQGDTRELAGRIAAEPGPLTMLPVHVVGCGRRCGSPTTAHVEALVIGDRVLVDGPDVSAGEVPPAEAMHTIAAARVPVGTDC